MPFVGQGASRGGVSGGYLSELLRGEAAGVSPRLQVVGERGRRRMGWRRTTASRVLNRR
jgi:hypothetical protein